MNKRTWRPISLGTLAALLLSLITVIVGPLVAASATTFDMTGNTLAFNHTNLTATITRVATSNGVITYTAANSFTAGQLVTITGVTSNPVNRFNLANVIIKTASSTTFTVLNAATGTYTSGGTATQLNDYRNFTCNDLTKCGVSNGDTVLYYNVGTISAGNTVDAVVTTTTTNTRIDNYDGTSASSGNAGYFQPDLTLTGSNGKAVFNFAFYEHGTYTGANTGTPVVLTNVTISSIDLDSGGGGQQFSEFGGFQQYTLTNNTMLTPAVVTGTRLERFTTRETANLANVPQDMVQVTYLTLSSIDVAVGLVGSSGALGYFGISFSALPWGASITDPVVGSPTTIGPRAITGITTSGGTVTYTTSANHGFSVGQSVTVTGCATSGYNGSSMTITTVASNKKFAVTKAQTGGSCPAGSATVTIPGVVTPAIGVSNVDNPANVAPSAANTTAVLTAGSATTLTRNDFGAASFTDGDSNPFYKVKITALPASGSFQHRVSGTWRSVTLNEEILTSDIDLENLRFTGSGAVVIKFRVHDGLVYNDADYNLGISITNRSQVITFPDPGTRAAGVTFDAGASSDSGLTVTLVSAQTGVCTIVDGTKIRTEAEGDCVITASQLGNATYSKATSVDRTLHVSGRQAQLVTFADPGRQILSTNPKTISSNASADSNLTVQLVSQTLDVCTVDGLNISLIAAGPCEVWAKQEGNATYASATTIKHNFDVILPSWTITFNKNRASSGTVPPVSEVTKLLSVNAPTNSGNLQLTGYSFAGWNTQADGKGSVTYQPGDAITPTADLALYAKWSASITYDANGATSGDVPAVQAVVPGINALALNSGTLRKSSHTFAGWNTLATGLGTSYAVGADFTVSGDVTLYAKWTSVITFSGNGESAGYVPPGSTPAVDSNVALPANTGTIRTGPLEKADHSFGGWNTNQQGTGTNYMPGVDTFPLTGNVTLYARWISTITYDANGGTGDAPTAQRGVDGNVLLDANPSNLTKGTFIFDHWSLTDDGSADNYGSGATFALSGNTTLFAIYAQRSYLRIVTPPKISQNANSITCSRGTFAYMDKGVTPVLASPTIANVFLLVGGTVFASAKPAVASSTVSWLKTDLATVRSGTALTCRVVANQGGLTPLTSESTDSPLAISLRAQQTKELNSIEATYQSDVNAAIAKQKAALAANPKLVMVFNATFKSEMSAAQSKKDAAIVASRIKRASEVAKAGIALIWP
ncbi:MAG: InlB B-repeat-containing protein [Actinomycetes bacterium]